MTCRQCFSGILAIAIGFALTSLAIAGKVYVIPSVVARFDNNMDFNPLPFTSPPQGPFVDGPGLYQIDLLLLTKDLQPGERGFASLAFNVELEYDSAIGFEYQPFPGPVDNNGPEPGGLVPKFATNTDAGIAGDYQGILVAAAGGNLAPIDPRATLGDPDPELFGSLFVQIGPGGGVVSLDNYQFSMRSATTGEFLTAQLGEARSLCFLSACFGSVYVEDKIVNYAQNAPVVTVLETLALTDELSPTAGWSLEHFDSPNGQPATVDPLTGEFSWVANGAPTGSYQAVIRYTSADGVFAEGGLHINWTVPEPASGSLALMAIVSIGILFRRSHK